MPAASCRLAELSVPGVCRRHWFYHPTARALHTGAEDDDGRDVRSACDYGRGGDLPARGARPRRRQEGPGGREGRGGRPRASLVPRCSRARGGRRPVRRRLRGEHPGDRREDHRDQGDRAGALAWDLARGGRRDGCRHRCRGSPRRDGPDAWTPRSLRRRAAGCPGAHPRARLRSHRHGHGQRGARSHRQLRPRHRVGARDRGHRR